MRDHEIGHVDSIDLNVQSNVTVIISRSDDVNDDTIKDVDSYLVSLMLPTAANLPARSGRQNYNLLYILFIPQVCSVNNHLPIDPCVRSISSISLLR